MVNKYSDIRKNTYEIGHKRKNARIRIPSLKLSICLDYESVVCRLIMSLKRDFFPLYFFVQGYQLCMSQ